MFAKIVDYLRNGRMQTQEEISMLLLSVSPIQHWEEGNEANSDTTSETIVFNSKRTYGNSKLIFCFFHVNIHKRAVCQICDNFSANLCIAELLCIPHIGCLNHKLNLNVNNTIDSDFRLMQTMKCIHTIMTDCKS